MSSPIDKIILRNFKAFYGDYEIGLEGKHLLLYGENGSGKSSIYWALYTLLQASTKIPVEIEKYFDFNQDEHLINRYYIHKQDDTHGSGNYTKDIGKNVEIEAQLQDGEILGISLNGLSAKTNPTILENLNRYSDFITHRLLIHFYNFRNSQEIDLWKVFVRDIFPFTYEDLDNGKKTIQELIEELENTQPFKIENDKIVDLPDGGQYNDYFDKIKSTNIEIDKWVNKISNDANELFTDYFDNKKGDFRIELTYIDRFNYAKHPFTIKNHKTEYSVLSEHKFLRTPKIILTISKKRNNGNWEPISRPQTYLNEALITQISLSIRLALTKSRAVNYPGQFLALDDLLISLDMSNRDKVLDIILDEFIGKYKVYIFTHEKSFFNKVKSRLATRNIIDNWVIKEMYMNTFVEPNSPKIVNNSCYLSQALKHLKEFDLPASANYLRKECEERLKQILPDNASKKGSEDETKYKQLEDLIGSFIKFYKEKLKQDPDTFNKLKEYKDFILNPLSHDNLDAEYYKNELLEAHNLLLKLRGVKRKQLLKVESLFIKKQNNANGDEIIYTIEALEELNAYHLIDGTVNVPNINCKVLHKTIGSTKTNLNHPVRFNKLQEVIYKHAQNKPIPGVPFPPDLDVFINIDGKSLRQIYNS
jgi:energy-coupling factor transporter ATP-binding protein EcfA2